MNYNLCRNFFVLFFPAQQVTKMAQEHYVRYMAKLVDQLTTTSRSSSSPNRSHKVQLSNKWLCAVTSQFLSTVTKRLLLHNNTVHNVSSMKT